MLARQASPADVVRQLVLLAHPQAGRLLPFIEPSQLDLFAVDVTLLEGFAERATRAVARSDDWLREFVAAAIDIGNAQNALLSAGEPREIDPGDMFVRGGRLLPADAFAAAARAGSPSQAVARLAAAFSGSPLASALPAAPSDAGHLDRAFLASTIERLTRAARIEPLTTAPVLRIGLLIEAQSRDLRALAWGAALGTPPSARRQQLVTPV
jgi:vacuolar-type H+-ATPase subunit C/Vma6